MRIYSSPKENNRWIFQPFRALYRGAGREDKIRKEAKRLDFRFVSVLPLNDALHVALTSEKGGYDFAARFLAYCHKAGIRDAVYLERNDDENNVIVIIKDFMIRQDKAGPKEDIQLAVESLMGVGELERMTLINFQFIDDVSLPRIEQTFANRIENISAALTDKLLPDDAVAFLPEREAIARIQARKPWLLYIAVASLAMLGASQLASLSQEPEQQHVIVNPWEPFFAAMNKDVVQVLNRMSQDYNIHVGLMALPGWIVDKVTHTKGQVSYRMQPSDKGDFETLSRFARANQLHVMVNQNEIVLVGHGANIRAAEEGEEKLYNVVQLHHHLRDAINTFIPGAEITFVRDVPKGAGNKWLIRELMFQFRGIYKEDLLTLGAITRGLPVSIGGDSGDPNAGQYIIDDERFTGGLKISIIGDKS